MMLLPHTYFEIGTSYKQAPHHQRVVFAATRYQWKGDHVYAHGACHLFVVDESGKGLRQITFGKGDDFAPKISFDGRHILFLRHFDDSQWIATIRMDLDGRHLTKIAQRPYTGYRDEVTEPNIRFPKMPIEVRDLNGRASLVRANGKVVKDLGNLDNTLLSPDTSAAYISVIEYAKSDSGEPNTFKAFMVDLMTGSSSQIPTEAGDWIWLDNRTLISSNLSEEGDSSNGKLLMADRSGKVSLKIKTHVSYKQKHKSYGDDFQS